MRSPTVARQFAGFILLVLMVGSGIATALSLAGNTQLALQVCGGALVVAFLVLLLGGVVVASNRPRE